MAAYKVAGWWGMLLVMGVVSTSARAECSNTIQCIGISANSPQEARRNHHRGVAGGSPGTTPGSVLVTLDFSNRPVAGTTIKTLYVAGAINTRGAIVRLDPIRITGPDADQFSLAGGTCALNGGNGPTQSADLTGAGHCTIEVKFSPTSPGVKMALLTVPFPQPNAGFIDHRDATLTGIGGDERVSPALDPQVAALIGSQVASLAEFRAAQVSNITSRLTSLQRARGADGERHGVAMLPATRNSRDPVDAPDRLPPGKDGAATTGDRAPEGSALTSTLASLLTTRQVSLNLASDAGTRAGMSGLGYWVGGSATFGRFGDQGNESRFETSGLTAGADLWLGRDLVVGGAVGYSRLRSTFGSTGSHSVNSGQSLSVYGSYQVMQDLYLDAILGYGSLNSRATRFVNAANSFASSERDGSQLHASLAVTKAFREDNLSWEPYGRIELSQGKLDRVDEAGAGISSLSYHKQTLRSSRLAFGLRTSATHELAFGSVTPQLRFEFGRDLTRVGAGIISYADQPGGPVYSIAPTTGKRSSALLGLGAEFLTHGGLSFGFELASNGRVSNNPEYSTRFWLSTVLDERKGLTSGGFANPSETPLSVSVSYRFDNNITRTGSPTPELSDRIWSVGTGIDHAIELSDSIGISLGALLKSDKFKTYEGLDNLAIGGRAELAFQAGRHVAAPRFGVFLDAAQDASRSDLRTGRRIEAGLTTRLLVAERTALSGLLSHSRRRAEGDVFDTDFNTARLAADQQFGDPHNMRLAIEARRGDFVSSGRPMADSAAVSEALVDDDALASKGFVAYRFPGKSLMLTLGYNLSLGSRDSLDIAWSTIRVTPTKTPDYTWFQMYPTMGLPGAGGNSPYSVQQIDIAYTMRF